MAMGDVIARLAVSLNLETAAFEKNARGASTTVGRMQAAMSKAASAIGAAFLGIGLGEAVTAFRDMGKAALDAAGGLGEQAAALGVSTGALQEFRFAATQVGLSTEQMDAALGQFSKRLGAAELSGKGPFVAALKEIGLSLDDLKGKSETQQIGLIADGINKIGSAAQQNALQVQFFGKAGQATATLLQSGSAGIAAFADEARKLGVVLSESEIAKADETADKLAKLNYVIEAQKNKKLLENADALVAYEQAVGDFKLAMITAVGDLENSNQRYNKWALDFNASLRRVINGVIEFQGSLASRFAQVIANIVSVGRDIVLGLARGFRVNAGAVWEALKGVVTSGISRAKSLLGIQSPSRVFMEIGDYIGQGLAIGIEGGSGRVAAATKKLTEAARRAAEETRALFARLFPELEKANQYRADLARIDASGRSPDAQSEARFRLGQEFAGNGEVPVQTWDVETDNVTESLDKIMERFDLFRDKGKTVSVQVAKSFADMAQATVQSLNSLAGAIKGGGFLDILSSVIGFGLQLGSIGLFGKSIANNINKPRGYATGTTSALSGLHWVGERGPELVNFSGGERVYNNRDSMRLADRETVIRVQLAGDLDARIVQGAGRVVLESAPAIIGRAKAETMRAFNRPALG